jgi:hypothetical protein
MNIPTFSAKTLTFGKERPTTASKPSASDVQTQVQFQGAHRISRTTAAAISAAFLASLAVGCSNSSDDSAPARNPAVVIQDKSKDGNDQVDEIAQYFKQQIKQEGVKRIDTRKTADGVSGYTIKIGDQTYFFKGSPNYGTLSEVPPDKATPENLSAWLEGRFNSAETAKHKLPTLSYTPAHEGRRMTSSAEAGYEADSYINLLTQHKDHNPRNSIRDVMNSIYEQVK